MSSPQWLDLRCIALIALSLTIFTTIKERETASKNSPTQLWDTAHRWLASRVEADEQNLDTIQSVSRAVSDLIDWTEGMIRMRGEDGASWFEGKAWLGLMELWISLGRRVRRTPDCSSVLLKIPLSQETPRLSTERSR